MKIQLSLRKVCTGLLLLAVLLRLVLGLLAPEAAFLRVPKTPRLLAFGSQESLFRQPAAQALSLPDKPSQIPTQPSLTLPPTTQGTVSTAPTEPEPPQKPSFSRQDAQYVSFFYDGKYDDPPDAATLLLRKLKLSLAGSEPTVLIIHTHATECYKKSPGESYTWYADYRTTDERYNMLSVGEALAQELEKAGISVIHDRTLHDHPSYVEAYDNSAATVRKYLKEYPSIQLVLDLHRDAAENSDGSQYTSSVLVNGEKTAKVMTVLGTNNPNWHLNAALAAKMQVLMEKEAPGITRETVLRPLRYNQHLSTGSLLIEIGTAGNTHDQVLRAVPILADAIIALMNGAN